MDKNVSNTSLNANGICPNIDRLILKSCTAHFEFRAFHRTHPELLTSEMIDENVTDEFRVIKSIISGVIEKIEKDFYIGIVVTGECSV